MYWAAGVALLVAMVAFAAAQPDRRPIAPGEVRFSKPSGFYKEAFYLELDADGGDIYYTLDSSDPSENGIPYTGPIRIQDASPNPNVYSNITDVSIYFDQELLERNNATHYRSYQVPDQPVDKATVVRAVSIDQDGQPGQPGDAVYFVGFGDKDGYGGMNIMSIATDPANLFDAEKGIYVLGNRFTETLSDGYVQDGGNNPFMWAANYRQRGRDWERPAAIHCFDANGNNVFSGQYGIRIQGKSNRASLPKNLSIFARKQYGSDEIDTGDLFEDRYLLNRMMLYYGENELLLADYLAEAMTEDLDITDRDMAPCVMFLNGEYWGVYWLAPKYKADYMSQEYGVDSRNIVVIKHGHAEVGQEEDEALYQEMVSYIAENDMSVPACYERACELLDMRSAIDYFAAEIYLANTDWPDNNISLWRSRYKEDSPFGDCRWRWILYDLEQGMVAGGKVDVLKLAINRDPVFASLMKNEGFSAALRQKLLALPEDTFSPDRVSAFIEAYKQRMAGPIEKKYQRFNHESLSLADFYEGCDKIDLFFRERPDIIKNKYGGKE